MSTKILKHVHLHSALLSVIFKSCGSAKLFVHFQHGAYFYLWILLFFIFIIVKCKRRLFYLLNNLLSWMIPKVLQLRECFQSVFFIPKTSMFFIASVTRYFPPITIRAICNPHGSFNIKAAPSLIAMLGDKLISA